MFLTAGRGDSSQGTLFTAAWDNLRCIVQLRKEGLMIFDPADYSVGLTSGLIPDSSGALAHS